jgi:hypothetical protein
MDLSGLGIDVKLKKRKKEDSSVTIFFFTPRHKQWDYYNT